MLRRILPGDDPARRGVESDHPGSSRCDDPIAAADDATVARRAVEALEAVEKRIVDANSGRCRDPKRAVGIRADIGYAVGRQRRGIVGIALIIIVGLSAVTAQTVVGRDPDVTGTILREAADRKIGQMRKDLYGRKGLDTETEADRRRHQTQCGRNGRTFIHEVSGLSSRYAPKRFRR